MPVRRSGFRPDGRVTFSFLCKEKVTKEKAHPHIRPRLGFLVPSLPGHAPKDVPVPSELSRRPCRSTPCASAPLGLLRGPGSRRASSCRYPCFRGGIGFLFSGAGAVRRLMNPLQEAERRRCVGTRGMDAEGAKGQGTSLRGVPRAAPERGSPRSGQTRMLGSSAYSSGQARRSKAPAGATRGCGQHCKIGFCRSDRHETRPPRLALRRPLADRSQRRHRQD